MLSHACRAGLEGQEGGTRTWGGRDTQHLFTEPGKHLHGVSLGLGVQSLVHLGQDDLAKVEEPCSQKEEEEEEAK